MKIKNIGKGIGIFAFIIMITFIGFLYTNQPNFKIYLNETEVNELIACCFELDELKTIDNLSRANNNTGSTTTIIDYNTIFCFTEENSEYFDAPCKPIKKEDLNIEWLDSYTECVRINNPCEDLKCNEGGECGYYKFGKYMIEIVEKNNEN